MVDIVGNKRVPLKHGYTELSSSVVRKVEHKGRGYASFPLNKLFWQ